MSTQPRTPSGKALREKLRALARTTKTFEASQLAKLAQDAGLQCSAEDIEALSADLSSELDDESLERVAGGAMATGWDLKQNVKI